MRIPSGDLSPARRRHYGGSYGRRRSRGLRGVIALVVLLGAGGGAYYLLHTNDTSAPARKQARPGAAACPTGSRAGTATKPARPLVLPAPKAVHVRLLNGTPRNGLGKSVGDQLAGRGFLVAVTGNSPRPQLGASRVAFGRGGQPAGTLLARTVLGATLVPDPRAAAGSVTVVLGSSFVRLRTPAEIAVLGRTGPAVRATPSGPPRAPCR